MQDKKRRAFPNLYLDQLKFISNIHFTSREIDIIACLLNSRGTIKIASLLGIAPRTVANHIYNMMQKLGCQSRDGIIDFIEKSNKQPFLKAHYNCLSLEASFKGTLKAIARLRYKIPPYILIYWKTQENNRVLLENLKDHLELAGVKTHLEMRNTEPTITHLKSESKDDNYRLYVMPMRIFSVEHSVSFEKLTTDPDQNFPKALFLFIGTTNLEEAPHELCGVDCIDFTEPEKYYLSVLEILKKLLPDINLETLTVEFKQQCEFISESPTIEIPQEILSVKTGLSFFPRMQSLLEERKWGLLIGCIAFISVLSIGFFAFKGGREKEPTVADSSSKQSKSSIRSDLILPSKTTLLDRPELLTQIDEKFKGQEGIQTIAIVGIGGSGKTTTARHYAHQQQENVVWEINAETNTNLMESFENLAQALAKTEEDKKILRGLLETKDSEKREKTLIEFVKEQLKLHSNWLLLYDNVENFTDIQKYFPHDTKTWGHGKIIFTTRNHNIQNSRQVDDTLIIGELTANQKLSLFTQIMNHGENHKLTANQKEETVEFLKKIPPFPLDVSVAADYLKTTNIPYTQYVECLNQQDKNFIDAQEKIRKEAGEYTQTRYSIITLSLEKLIASNKEFADLLLFISLLDSQNIPINLLEKYKSSSVVNSFIYHLKKFSLIMRESPIPLVGPTLSIHRSTQAITLAHLIKTLKLEKNNQSIELIASTLKNYMRNVIDREDFPKMKPLLKHYEVFLSHNNLLSNPLKGIISGELGYLYYNLSNDNKAEESLKKSLLMLKNCPKKDHGLLFRPLSYLGTVYWKVGKFEKAQNFLEQSIELYERLSIRDTAKLCQSLTYLGMLYIARGSFERSKNLLEKSLLIHTKSRFQNYSELAFILTHLGDVYLKLGNYKKAQFYLERSVAIYKKHLTDTRASAGWAAANLGYMYEIIGYFEKSKILYEQTLNIYKEYYPQDSLEIAWALRNLGSLHIEMGNFRTAQCLLERSVIIFKKRLGEKNIKTKWVYYHLGRVYKQLGQFEKAKRVFENCLKYEKNSLLIGGILRETGQLYLLENNLEIAEDFLNKSLNTYQKNSHPSEYKCLEIFSDLHFKKSLKASSKKDTKSAQNFKIQSINDLKKALKIIKTHFPEDSPHIPRIQDKLKKLEQGFHRREEVH